MQCCVTCVYPSYHPCFLVYIYIYVCIHVSSCTYMILYAFHAYMVWCCIQHATQPRITNSGSFGHWDPYSDDRCWVRKWFIRYFVLGWDAYCQHKHNHKLGATATSLKPLFLIISNQRDWNSDGQDCVRVTLTTLPINTSEQHTFYT